MRCRLVVATLLLCSFAVASSAEIYRWTDAQGRLHFAQSLAQVPATYRSKAVASGDSTANGYQTYESAGSQPGVADRDATLRIPFRREASLMRVDALVNGHLDVPFLIDTGASGVSIPTRYARQLGIRIDADTPQIQVQTANGVIAVPIVRLDSVKLGGAQVEGLMATVNLTMPIGLLGGAFFNNFSYAVDPAASVITLKRNHAAEASGLDEAYWRRRFREVRGPLLELESYLETRQITRQDRREDLHHKLSDLKQKLNELEIEANRDSVPVAWRR